MRLAKISLKYKSGIFSWFMHLKSSRDVKWVLRLYDKHSNITIEFLVRKLIKSRRYHQETKRSLHSALSKNWDLVPEGMYCYTRWSNETIGCTFPCPYWTWKNGDAWCNLIQETDSILLWDQCKICGINEDSEDDRNEHKMC